MRRTEYIKKLFKDEFKDLLSTKVHIDSEVKTMGKVIYCPETSFKITNPGLLLKDEIGYISITETLNENNEVQEYTYRFISSIFECTSKSIITNQNNKRNYSFHYDACNNDIPHRPHINVIYPDIRFHSERITLKDFLFFITTNFYNTKKTSCKVGNIWENHFE